jgi:hypothetical protein
VPEQHEVVEVLGLDQVHHVGEVGVEADLLGRVAPSLQAAADAARPRRG